MTGKRAEKKGRQRGKFLTCVVVNNTWLIFIVVKNEYIQNNRFNTDFSIASLQLPLITNYMNGVLYRLYYTCEQKVLFEKLKYICTYVYLCVYVNIPVYIGISECKFRSIIMCKTDIPQHLISWIFKQMKQRKHVWKYLCHTTEERYF
jgi:hypothetical protein